MHTTTGFLVPVLVFAVAGGAGAQSTDGPELTYLGRSTFKIRTMSGFVLYVDPYAPGDYSEAADLVLVSHGHGDHNAVEKVKAKPGCVVMAPAGAVTGRTFEAIKEGETRTIGPVTIRAMPAANSNHPRGFGVGYLLSFDGIVLYYSGDTSKLAEMGEWKGYGIDYALICSDGFYNMGAEEAARCATLMGARRLVPVHTSRDGLYDDTVARSAKYPDLVVLGPGSKRALVK